MELFFVLLFVVLISVGILFLMEYPNRKRDSSIKLWASDSKYSYTEQGNFESSESDFSLLDSGLRIVLSSKKGQRYPYEKMVSGQYSNRKFIIFDNWLAVYSKLPYEQAIVVVLSPSINMRAEIIHKMQSKWRPGSVLNSTIVEEPFAGEYESYSFNCNREYFKKLVSNKRFCNQLTSLEDVVIEIREGLIAIYSIRKRIQTSEMTKRLGVANLILDSLDCD